ncbi:hypothetical protein RvY_19371 [Ramazzottius varieornatus]|uniref:Uncharacterized protein n=1 Tax=Ramazzottius varieornatus TaxID=947166 RepID=A0A1D1WA66_RAMVA|nr:hypothetical protein RvY_19371 [Ramazzottius varieornatus]
MSDLEWLNFKNGQHVAVVRKVLLSDKKKNIWYYVDISLTTGEAVTSLRRIEIQHASTSYPWPRRPASGVNEGEKEHEGS